MSVAMPVTPRQKDSREEKFLVAPFPARYITFPAGSYECRAVVRLWPDGGFAASAANLDGAAARGATIDEAIANVAQAFQAVVHSHLKDNGRIPWVPVDASGQLSPGDVERRFVVQLVNPANDAELSAELASWDAASADVE